MAFWRREKSVAKSRHVAFSLICLLILTWSVPSVVWAQQEQRVSQYWPALSVEETPDAIRIKGLFFDYTIDRKNGLFVSTKVQGQEFLAEGGVLPAPFVSPDVDCQRVRFEARYSPKTEVTILEKTPEAAVISARGQYADADGKTFPMRYELTYRVEFDGFVKVDLNNVATADGSIRWICTNAVRLRQEPIQFVSRNEDLTEDWGGGPYLKDVEAVKPTEARSRFLFGQVALSFVHFGNPKTGIEFYQTDFTNQTFGYKDGSRFGAGRDAMGFRYLMTEVWERSDAYELQMMSLRDSFVPVRPGWSRANSFSFMVTPTKEPRRDLEQVRVWWLGPHQYQPGFRHPDENTIRRLAQAGINVVVGGANYESGDYANPEGPEQTRNFIATCHRYGIRVVPYVTFSDLAHVLPAAKEHLEEWMAEPKIEYRYSTTLMCFNCRPWREYWKGQVTKLFEQYDFDGLYIDMWVSTLGCVNQRHGCNGRLKTYTIEGLREFTKIARQCVMAGRSDRFVMVNSNEVYASAPFSLVDIRLVGENTRLEEKGPPDLQVLLEPRRTGSQTLLMSRRRYDAKLVNIALTYDAPPRSTGNIPAPGTGTGIWRYWDVFRTFQVDRATPISGLNDPEVIATSNADCRVSAWARDGELLSTLMNWGTQEAKTKLELKDLKRLGLKEDVRYRVFDCLAGRFVDEGGLTLAQLADLELVVTTDAPRALWVRPEAGLPLVLAVGSDGLRGVTFDAGTGLLRAKVAGVEGTSVRLVIEAGTGVKTVKLGGQELADPATPQPGIVVFQAVLPADPMLEIQFGR